MSCASIPCSEYDEASQINQNVPSLRGLLSDRMSQSPPVRRPPDLRQQPHLDTVNNPMSSPDDPGPPSTSGPFPSSPYPLHHQMSAHNATTVSAITSSTYSGGARSLLTSSTFSTNHRQMMPGGAVSTSVLLEDDQGEYFYDDDFSVPFDANLREENNNNSSSGGTGEEGSRDSDCGGPRMTGSRSDSCLYRSPYGDEEMDGDDEEDQILDQLVANDDPLFTNSMFRSTGVPGTPGSMTGPSGDASGWTAALGTSLRGRIDRGPTGADYKLVFGSPSKRHQRSHSEDKDPNACSQYSQISGGSSVLGTWGTPGNTLSTTGRSASPMTTWGRIRSSKESINTDLPSSPSCAVDKENCNQPPRKQARKVQPAPTAKDSSDESLHKEGNETVTTWKQMKKAASSKFVSWRQLKEIVKKDGLLCQDTPASAPRTDGGGLTTLAAQSKRPPGLMSATLTGVHLRSHSAEPGERRIGETKHRFSGTLLELYRRAHAYDMSDSSDSRYDTCETTHHPPEQELEGEKPPGTQKWFNNLFTQSLSGSTEATAREVQNAIDLQMVKGMAHFGAQFPTPTHSQGVPAQGQTPHSRSQSAMTSHRLSGIPGDVRASGGRPRSSSLGVATSLPLRPGQKIVYPGLGMLAVPRPSRLCGSAFLSRTLPDLAFLADATLSPGRPSSRRCHSSSVARRRSGPPKPPRRTSSSSACTFASATTPNQTCTSGDSGFESTNDTTNQTSAVTMATGTSRFKRHSLASVPVSTTCRQCGCSVDCGGSDDNPSTPTGDPTATSSPRDDASIGSPLVKHRSVPDLITQDLRRLLDSDGSQQASQPLKSCLIRNRSSLDDCSSIEVQPQPGKEGEFLDSPGDFAENGKVLICSRGSEECTSSQDDASGNREFRAKKSVSFSEKILFHTPPISAAMAEVMGGGLRGSRSAGGLTGVGSRPRPLSMVSDLRVIPRDCGLYGQDPPLAEFQLQTPLPSNTPQEPKKSDMDLRYQALVNDVIKSVQQAVAFFSRSDVIPALSASQGSETSQTSTGGTSTSPLGLIAPLTTLVSDGLLPPARQIFGGKQRPRLWLLVEESCRPGIANHVLTEVFNEIKSLPNLTAEKSKFKAFACACLNAKSLSLWLSSVVNNEGLLKRYYCDDAFLRRCRSSQRELHADLTTSLELLLSLPFRIDINAECRGTSTTSTALSAASKPGHPVRARHDIRPATTHIPPTNGPPPPVPRHANTKPTTLGVSPSAPSSTVANSNASAAINNNNGNKAPNRLKSAFSNVRQRTDGYFRRTGSSSSSITTSSTAPSPQSPTGGGLPATVTAHHLPGKTTSHVKPVRSISPASSTSQSSVSSNSGRTSRIPQHNLHTGGSSSTTHVTSSARRSGSGTRPLHHQAPATRAGHHAK